MATISRSKTWVDTDILTAADLNGEFDTVYNEVNGSLSNANVSATAAVAGSKLDLSSVTTITTSGNVTIGGTLTQTGVASFTATPKIDHIAENTTSHGVSIDNKLTVKNTIQTVTAASDGATVTFDLSLGNVHTVTLGGNRTLAISNETAGQCFIIELTQDGTGSRTVTWFTTIRWADGSAPTLTTTASKRDVVGFRVTGTDTYDGYIVGQNI